MPAPEPVAKTASATYSSMGHRSRTSVGIPRSAAISRIVRRVMPGSAERSVGVTSVPPITAKTFAAVSSATAPRWSSMIASPAPAAFACRFAITAST